MDNLIVSAQQNLHIFRPLGFLFCGGADDDSGVVGFGGPLVVVFSAKRKDIIWAWQIAIVCTDYLFNWSIRKAPSIVNVFSLKS